MFSKELLNFSEMPPLTKFSTDVRLFRVDPIATSGFLGVHIFNTTTETVNRMYRKLDLVHWVFETGSGGLKHLDWFSSVHWHSEANLRWFLIIANSILILNYWKNYELLVKIPVQYPKIYQFYTGVTDSLDILIYFSDITTKNIPMSQIY